MHPILVPAVLSLLYFAFSLLLFITGLVMRTSSASPSNIGPLAGHFLTRSTRPHQTGPTSVNHKFGSVKYNRISNSNGPKEEVHETHSNPIPTSVSVAGVCGTSAESRSLVENRFVPMSGYSTASDGVGVVTPRKMSTLEAPPPLPYISPTKTRQKQLVLSPPSLHISFDVEPENCRGQQLVSAMPMSQSSDNVRHFHQRYDSVGSSCSSTGRSYSPNHLRRPVAYRHSQHRRFLESSDIAQISAGYMRANGTLQQFKGILSGPEKSPSLLTKVLQKEHSKEKEREREREKDDSCSTHLLSGGLKYKHNSLYFNNNNNNAPSVFSSIDDVKSTGYEFETLKPIAASSRSPSSALGATAAAEATLEVLTSQTRRLGYRQMIFDRRTKACDYACVFAVLGIFMMIVENEMTAAGIYTKSCSYSYCLKSLIVLSTIILLMLILTYHAVDIQLFMSDLGCRDWRILIDAKRLAQITAELLACIICPIPGDFYFTWRTVHHDGKTVTSPRVPVDVLLSIPMFLRLYLLCRLMLLHSRLFTDAPSRSIGALNKVTLSARLILKTLMTTSPGTVLLSFTISWWLMAAWVMLVCERYHGYPYHIVEDSNKTIMHYEAIKHQNYLNSLWLVTVTSLTIGYGDIVPNTYCGRAVSVICGIMGAGTSSLVVAVVAKKLELSRAEKHVHNFMMDTLLTKKLKCAAANVLRETWLIYKNKKLGDKANSSKIRFHQRKFLLAIYQLRKVKKGQRKLSETATTVADMAKTSTMMYEMISDMRSWQQELEDKLVGMDQRCANVEAYMRQLQISIRALPEVVARKLQRPASSNASFRPQSACESVSSQPPSGLQSTENPPMLDGYSSPE